MIEKEIIEAVIKKLNDEYAPKWYELWNNQINGIWETNSHNAVKDFIKSLRQLSSGLNNVVTEMNELNKRVFKLENSGIKRFFFWRKPKTVKYHWPLPLSEETKDIYYNDMILSIKNLDAILDKMHKDQGKKQ